MPDEKKPAAVPPTRVAVALLEEKLSRDLGITLEALRKRTITIKGGVVTVEEPKGKSK